VAIAVMMQRATLAQWHTNHRLLGSSRRLGNGFRHFACLAMTEADPALAVADDDECRKAKALAALHRLGNAVDVNELFDQLFAAVIAAATTIVATPATVAVTATAIAAGTAAWAATTTPATRTATRAALRGVHRRALGSSLDCRLVGFVGHS
jgi:hypothetical protein